MFTNKEVQQKYEERLKNYTDAVCMREPKRLPVGVNFHTAQIAWAGTNVKRCVYNGDFYAEACSEFYKDYDVDLLTIPLLNALEAIWILGRDTFFVSKDGITVQYKENVPMEGYEYDKLIADPMEFITGTLFPRKFPHLVEGHDSSYELLRAVSEAFIRFKSSMAKYSALAKDKYGIIGYNGGKVYVPFDVLLDRIRGVANTLVDIRRQPEKVIQACEALMPIYLKPMTNLSQPVPHGFCTIHAPMFLNRKQFEKFYWPGFKQMLMHAYEKGSLTWVQLQGNCEHIYDYFLELPKGAVILNIEKEDPIKIKKKYGHHIVIEAGIPFTAYRYKSNQECLDMAKRIIDECAPGGGFIFGAEFGGLSAADLCKENMSAVFQLVHDYR
ncbi:uroporphyrinogen decarboxylase (URO-D) [Oxobacter pfennigii]|uniref:Uroporphyrinogen decarboxylase (URO-D) n=1 Tax=Oxobacter pfennigii TaxID=36849 RepID=A0A0N8NTI1_9CLOT|nr:uroporphyrinogen decarboxylase family protein [Oxobacter pfennigii]KPU44896.1 uroporphyrinogen decarboxylase (URO-D) [Oxobacter pfennigii]